MKYSRIIVLILLLTACKPSEYVLVSDTPIDGYFLYLETKQTTCNQTWTDIYYSGESYNYGFEYKACNWEKRVFILYGGEYEYLRDAVDQGVVTIESLLPYLEQIEREPEEIASDEADYYWMDFHINGDVVYVYAGGECDQAGSEEFLIDGITYEYTASGCLQEHILYMRVDGDEVPIADLILDGTVEPQYLIPMLTELP
jgi:hypothetical protein